MAKLRIDDVGSVGLVRDSEPWKVPAAAWTTLENAICKDGTVGVFDGFSSEPLDQISGLKAVYVYTSPSQDFFIICTESKVYVYTAGVPIDITPTSGIGYSVDLNWRMLNFNGVMILNNGVDEPLLWDLNVVEENQTSLPRLKRMSDYTDEWAVGQSCRSLVSFNNSLFACNVSEGASDFPVLVKFSDFATAGSVPHEWYARPSNSAGDFFLSDNLSPIVDAIVFKEFLLIFKDKGVYGIRFVGGNSVYSSFQISSTAGLHSRGCLAVTDNFILALTKDDVLITKGGEFESVIDQRLRRELFSNIDPDLVHHTFVQHDAANNSIWIFIPYIGNIGGLAYIWNYTLNTWQTRNTGSIVSATTGFAEIDNSPSWEALTLPWEQMDEQWEDGSLGITTESLILAQSLDEASVETAVPYDESVVNLPSTLERKWIPFPRGDVLDWDTVKYVTEVWLKFRTTGEWAQGVEVWLAGQMYQDDPLVWKKVGEFFPNTSRKKVGSRVSGRFISIKLVIPPESAWQLSGYDVEYKLISRR